MSCKLPLNCVAVLLLGAGPLLNGSDEPRPPRVELHGVIPQVHIAVQIRATDRQISVPYCGLVGSDPIICTQFGHLEMETPTGWVPAPRRTGSGVLGAEREMGMKVASPGESMFIVFEFSRRWVAVETGQTVRVVLDAWPDQSSMDRQVDRIQLTSPPFKCPESGIGFWVTTLQ